MDALIAALQRAEAYDHPVGAIRLIETHISWVLLTGRFAYKIKKPVNLGFLDYHTLALREQACREELRLNRRLAPDLYRDVVAIRGPREQARCQGEGPVIEWAVRMLEFPQEALLPQALERGALADASFEALADRLADFHDRAAVAPPQAPWGNPATIAEPALANLAVLASCGTDASQLAALRHWTEHSHAALVPAFAERRRQGRIRECHGDLHLGNMALLDGRITVFDGIEFSPGLRWIDVLSDLAFLAMDLDHRGRPDLAARVLNRWLQRSGDYPGLVTWRWYLTYRALVRAKVAAVRLSQGDQPAGERLAHARERDAYLQRAGTSSHATGPAPSLVITHGVSGSGKSHWARRLCAALGWIHLRSDVERKREFGLPLESPSPVPVPGLYAGSVSERLYGQRLPACADAVVAAGLSLIVDATFLAAEQREALRRVARRHGCRFVILDFEPEPELARSRLLQRRRQGSDPSDADTAVLDRQLQQWLPLAAGEADQILKIPAAAGDGDLEAFVARLK